MNSIPPNHFDRAKPFYPLIMNYLFQLHGINELAIRGLIGARKITEEDICKIVSDNFNGISDAFPKEIEDIRTFFDKLQGPLELRSDFNDRRIVSERDEICKELLSNFSYLLPHYVRATGHLLILAYSMTQDKSYRDKGPLWKFLRHCRNAAAHNGLFTFRRDEPKPEYPAVWGPFEIKKELEGTPLLKDEQGYGLLSIGDPIRLLWDIEQAYPDMRV